MTKDITTEERAVCFKLLNEYARTKHNYLVTEFFLSPLSDVYFVCFRPVGGTKDSPNRYACKYLQFGMEDIRTMASAESLPDSDADRLDEALSMLPKNE